MLLTATSMDLLLLTNPSTFQIRSSVAICAPKSVPNYRKTGQPLLSRSPITMYRSSLVDLMVESGGKNHDHLNSLVQSISLVGCFDLLSPTYKQSHFINRLFDYFPRFLDRSSLTISAVSIYLTLSKLSARSI